MLKKSLILSIIIGLSSLAICAMEKPATASETSRLTISQPLYGAEEKEYKIEAIQDGQVIGYAFYKPFYFDQTQWVLSELWAEGNHRRKGIAGQLLQACSIHSKQQQAKTLSWYVNPIENTDRHTMTTIYATILEKMGVEKSAITYEIDKTHTKMTWRLA